jgi:hypothetical protein
MGVPSGMDVLLVIASARFRLFALLIMGIALKIAHEEYGLEVLHQHRRPFTPSMNTKPLPKITALTSNGAGVL